MYITETYLSRENHVWHYVNMDFNFLPYTLDKNAGPTYYMMHLKEREREREVRLSILYTDI